MSDQPLVRDLGDGRTAIRWYRVGFIVCLMTVACTAIPLGLAYYRDVDTPWLAVLPQFFLSMLWLLFSIEVQRQVIETGTWQWRFSIGGMFFMTFLVALACATVVNMIQASKREFAFTAQVKETVQLIIKNNGGDIYAQSRGGRFVITVIRTDFNDNDLARVIDATKRTGDSVSLIVSISLLNTSVTEAGLKQLEQCPKLEVLSLSLAPPLSKEAITSLTKLRKLKFLSVTGRKFTTEELNELHKAMPTVNVNGNRLRSK